VTVAGSGDRRAATGVALVEATDADSSRASSATSPAAARSAPATTLLSTGFNVNRTKNRTVLIRASAPRSPLSASPPTPCSPIAARSLRLDRKSVGKKRQLGRHDRTKAAFTNAGAFGLADTSKDAALLLSHRRQL